MPSREEMIPMSGNKELSSIAEESLSNVSVGEYDRWFTHFHCGQVLEFYLERIKAIGFFDKQNVLDVACGIGQYSLALALLNKTVQGLDLKSSRIEIARQLCSTAGAANVNFVRGNAERLPYADEAFDAVFCFDTLEYVCVRKAIKEFARVLRPGGVCYINVHSLGSLLRLIIERGLLGLNSEATRATGGRAKVIRVHSHLLWRTLWFHHLRRTIISGIWPSEKFIRGILNANGLVVREFRGDGEIGQAKRKLAKLARFEDFYPARYLGLWCVFELMAEKPS